METSKVIFIPVKDSRTKLHAITRLAQYYFINKIRMLFCVASNEAAHYLDDLLWKLPPESFLPHLILTHPSSESIAITTTLINVNQASIIFNLRPEANPLAATCHITYDYFDETHPTKLEQSIIRKEVYTQRGLKIS